MELVKFKNEVSPLYVRVAARIVCKWLNKTQIKSFQCIGEKNWEYSNSRVDVQVPTEDIMHWVLRTTGHDVSVSDVMKRYNRT